MQSESLSPLHSVSSAWLGLLPYDLSLMINLDPASFIKGMPIWNAIAEAKSILILEVYIHIA